MSGGYLTADKHSVLDQTAAPGKYIPLNGHGLVIKPVGDEDLVLVVLVAGGQDVGALDRLGKVAKDVKDEEDALCGVGRASHVFASTGVMSAHQAL